MSLIHAPVNLGQKPYRPRHHPLMTWLRLCLSACLLVACGGSSNDGDEQPLQAAQLIPMTDATFAGRTDNPDMFAAVLTHANGVDAYFCDGIRDFWFRGSAGDSPLVLQNSSGAELVLELDADSVRGGLTSGSTVTAFNLPKATGEVLFRGETFLGEQHVLGGWIRLPDGEQRGVVKFGDKLVNSELSEGIKKIECGGCEAVSDMIAAPFTPTTATRTANQPVKFTVIGMGDSFMSGEGAPKTLGDHTNAGQTTVMSEVWSSGMPQGANLTISATDETRLRSEAKACHRGASGLGLAVAALQILWPSVALVHQNFACSGAIVSNLFNTSVSGHANCAKLSGNQKNDCNDLADDLPTQSIVPQLTAVLNFLSGQQLNADAVVMSIGGNDLGFGEIISDCLQPVPGFGCDGADSAARKALDAGVLVLPGRYEDLNDAFNAAHVPSANVFITKHLNPMRQNGTETCGGLEFTDQLLRSISDEEGVFVKDVVNVVNQQVNLTQKLGWNIISSHLGSEVGHGVCTTVPWYNDNTTALRTQGRDLWVPGSPLTLSSGMLHPNQSGQREGYKPGYQAALQNALRRRFTPRKPERFRAVAFARNNGKDVVTMRWDDPNNFESKSIIRNTGNGARLTKLADVNQADFVLSTSSKTSSGLSSLVIKACFDGDVEICSAETAPVNVEIKIPTHVPNITGRSVFGVDWSDLGPSRLFSTIEFENHGELSRRAVEGQSAQFPGGFDIFSKARFRIAACNNLGCGSSTAWQDVINRP